MNALTQRLSKSPKRHGLGIIAAVCLTLAGCCPPYFCVQLGGGNSCTITDQVLFATGRDGSYDIASVRPDGSSLQLLTRDGVEIINQHPVFNGDCSVVVWDRNGELWTMNSDGSDKQALPTGAPVHHVGHPWVGADDHVYFVGDYQGTHTLWRMPLDGSAAAVRLTDSDAERFHPNLHRDRTHLVYTWSEKGKLDEEDFGNTRIRVLNIDTLADDPLYEPGWPVSAAVWHPDGHSVIVAEDENRDGRYTIARVRYPRDPSHPDGGRLETPISGDDNTIPYFDYPAGDRINWVKRVDGQTSEIYGAAADGSNPVNLSQHVGEDTKIVAKVAQPDPSNPADLICEPRPASCTPNPPPCPLEFPPNDGPDRPHEDEIVEDAAGS
jgi:hypothetical protein